MSSLARRLQIRIWQKQAKEPSNHNAAHGGNVKVDVPNTAPVVQVEVNRFKWPLLVKDFNPIEA